MQYIVGAFLMFLSLFVGFLGFSQIFICMFFAIPSSLKLKKLGVFIPETPIFKKYIPPIIIWSLVLFVYLTLARHFAHGYAVYVIGGLSGAMLIALFNSGDNKNNIDDFMEGNAQYLNTEESATDQ